MPAVALHHRVAGPPGARAVVLAHSIGTALEAWDAVAAVLVAAGLRVVRADLRGHGASPVPPGPYALAERAAVARAEGPGALADVVLPRALARIAAPTLVIAGADDPATPPAGHGALIAERDPGARLAVLPGAAHQAAVKRPETVATLLLAHLDASAPA